MRSDIPPGSVFPDHELPDHESVHRELSELQGDDPLILRLARGHYPKIAVAYTRMATISTDKHYEYEEFRALVGAQRPCLSDPERPKRAAASASAA